MTKTVEWVAPWGDVLEVNFEPGGCVYLRTYEGDVDDLPKFVTLKQKQLVELAHQIIRELT